MNLESIDLEAQGGIEIHLSGVDILDGTPVLDIKPYLPYADIVSHANAGWAGGTLERFPVSFSPESTATLEKNSAEQIPRLRELIEQMLGWDPRPASQREAMPLHDPQSEGRIFRFRISRYDVEWQIRGQKIHVLQLHDL